MSYFLFALKTPQMWTPLFALGLFALSMLLKLYQFWGLFCRTPLQGEKSNAQRRVSLSRNYDGG